MIDFLLRHTQLIDKDRLRLIVLLAVLSGCSLSLAYAETDAVKNPAQTIAIDLPPPLNEEVLVTGGKDAIRTLSGSAQLLDQATLQQFDYTDINQVMSFLPGVYVRQEDGYGLRPNIGIRGAAAERSQKITLMEDGVLIAPAPYSAPAAYYFPNVSRMRAVEVLKGPAAIQYGPNTVGGAINLVTQAIPDDTRTVFDGTAGSFGFTKLNIFHGQNTEKFGFWVDGLHFGSDGFKELDGGGDTGFVRNDLNTKLQWRSAADAVMPQQLTVKLGYADETSDETYLGLTDDDFRAKPVRRYRASQLDQFNSEHQQIHFDHTVQLRNDVQLNSKLYWHDFQRAWNKFDGFIAGPPPELVLADPDNFTQQIALLRGEINSDGSDEQLIDVTNNDRRYGSYGVEVKGVFDWSGPTLEQALTVGLRWHRDDVERNHSVKAYLMTDGQLVFDGIEDRPPKILNQAETDALAVYIQDKLYWQRWEFTLGLRYEDIDGSLEDKLAEDTENARSSNKQSVVIPGLGVFWQYTDRLGFLLGINKGFSPAGPGSGSNVDPEESVNYEFGLRYQNQSLSVDWIGFFSDYENLLGRCRVSDTGCDVGDEFNGGAVEIAGSEVTVVGEWSLTQRLNLPVEFSYTYTESAFQSSFLSDFSQWGLVRKGDELPYLPENSARLQIGLSAAVWEVLLAVKHQDAMREQPGRGDINQGPHTDRLTTIDASVIWDINQHLLLQLTADNITDEQKIVSRRPFGARPNKPRSLNLRVKYEF